MAMTNPSFDLKTILKDKILNSMIKDVKLDNINNNYHLLIVDDVTIQIINNCLKLHEVVEAGVTVIVPISLIGREKVSLPAIYFLKNSDESINSLISDFKSNSRSLYTKAYLYFTSPLTDKQESMINSCDALMDRLGCLKYLNCEFISKESRFYTFGRSLNVPTLYGFGDEFIHKADVKSDYAMEIELTAHQLCSLCISLNEMPYVRYYSKNKVSKDIAAALVSELENTKNAFPDIRWNSNRGVLLVVDRALDPVAPLMHEYTYQAAVYDMMEFKGNTIITPGILSETDPVTNKKKDLPVVIDEYDALWQRYRHEHIGVVGQGVTDEMNHFLNQHKDIVALERGNNADGNRVDQLKVMAKIGSSLQSFEDNKKKFTKHVNISSFILEKFTGKYINGKLRAISELEQDMSTGVDNDGHKTKKNKIGERLVEFIKDPAIPVELKLRLIMIYIVSQDGIEAQTRRTLFKEAAISAEQSLAVENLFHLGVTLQSSSKKGKTLKLRPDQLEKAAQRARDVPLELMRFLPLLQEVMNDLIIGKLLEEDFPYARDTPPKAPTYQTRAAKDVRVADATARSARANRANRPGGKEEKKEEVKEIDNGPKFIVYVAGGCTFSEIRSAYDLSKDTACQLVLGSNNTITSSSFVNELSYKKKELEIKSDA